MVVSIYTGYVRNQNTGKERLLTRIVCENEVLWSGPDSEECYVSFVSYSSDPLTRVEYEFYCNGLLAVKGEYLSHTAPIFDAVYRGEDRVLQLLFREIAPKITEGHA